MRYHHASRMEKGFLLIDALIGTFFISIAFFAIFGVFKLSVGLVSNTKARISATSLAQGKIEEVRSLAYDDIGIVAGIPPGAIPPMETISINGVTYTRNVAVTYFDNDKDGLAAADSDGADDYKQVRVEVEWNLRGTTKNYVVVTNIAE